MEIRELFLIHYGKFDHHTLALKPGINIIYGGNEAGKSTIHSFVRAMLFGLNRGRGKAAKTDEYQIRQPWDTPGAFLGSMKLEDEGKIYRIDRCFDRSARPLQVTCETTGQEFPRPEEAMETLLGGISEAAFINTVFIPQARCETEDALARELQRYMVNSDSAMDADLDVSGALQSLRKKKKALEQQKKKEESRLEETIAGKQLRAETIRAAVEDLKGREAAVSEPGQGRPEIRETSFSESGKKKADPGKRVLELLLVLAGILALAGAFFFTEWKLRTFLGVFGIVFWLMLLPVHFLIISDETDSGDAEEENAQEEPRNMGETGWIRKQIQDREKEYRRLQDELEALYGSRVGPESVDTEIAAVSMAIDRICELSSGICARSGGALNERASDILSELTGGAYTRIRLDETMEVRIHTPSRVLGLHQVSGGTMQQVYFALRMAAGEILSQGKDLPLILDETFAMYDDVRLEAALRWLRKSGRQVILFTCQKREREILRQIDARQP